MMLVCGMPTIPNGDGKKVRWRSRRVFEMSPGLAAVLPEVTRPNEEAKLVLGDGVPMLG